MACLGLLHHRLEARAFLRPRRLVIVRLLGREEPGAASRTRWTPGSRDALRSTARDRGRNRTSRTPSSDRSRRPAREVRLFRQGNGRPYFPYADQGRTWPACRTCSRTARHGRTTPSSIDDFIGAAVSLADPPWPRWREPKTARLRRRQRGCSSWKSLLQPGAANPSRGCQRACSRPGLGRRRRWSATSAP